MRYDYEYEYDPAPTWERLAPPRRRTVRGFDGAARRRGRGRRQRPRRRRPRRRGRRPVVRQGPWYAGPGELHRYGDAPVPYGRQHAYDYHLGDRFGYGPDFYEGEARIRREPGLRERRPPRSRRR